MINHHPKIVTNGLVLNVDPANPKSYPAKDDPYIGNVSLLLPFDGANGSTSVSDMSLNNFTVTANGNAQISTAQSKFGGSSAAFDGNGDYFSLAANAAWSLGTTWTVEAWIYPNTTSAGKPISTRGATFGNMWEFFSFYNGIWNIEGYGSNNTGGLKGSTNTYSAAQWYHLAAVTTGGSTKIYVNGVLDYTYNNNYTWATDKALTIGGSLAYSEWFNGYIDDVRITSAARYTANFTPPTRLTALPGRIYDLTTNKGTGSFIGGPTYNSSNNGNIIFDGINDYINFGNYSSANFGTSNFTINMWIKTTSTTGGTILAKSTGDSANVSYGWLVYLNATNSGEIGFATATAAGAWSASGNYIIRTSGAAVNNGSWKMVTIVADRTATNVSIYINGILQTLTTWISATASLTTVGNITNSQILCVGNESDFNVPGNATFSAIQLYNKALTISEILQNYNAAKGRFGL